MAGMQTVVFTFDSGLTPLLPTALCRHPVVRAWTEGATLKYTTGVLRVPHTEIGQVLVDDQTMMLEALLPARGHVTIPAAESFLPATPLHFLYNARLDAMAHLLRIADFDAAYDSDYADAAIGILVHEEDWIVLSCGREFLKRRGIWRGTLIRTHESQAQMCKIITHLRLIDVAKPFSCCLRCNVLLRTLNPEEASASVPPRVRERQRLFSTCGICRRVYWPGSHWVHMNAMLTDML